MSNKNLTEETRTQIHNQIDEMLNDPSYQFTWINKLTTHRNGVKSAHVSRGIMIMIETGTHEITDYVYKQDWSN